MGGKRFHGDVWFQEKVNGRVKLALERQNAEFARAHRADTDQQLLDYIRDFAGELGRTPNSCEIIGGAYIGRRFGDWAAAVEAAGLPRPSAPPQPTRRLIYKREFKRQAALFQRERREAKERRKARHRQDAACQPAPEETADTPDTCRGTAPADSQHF